MWAPLVVLAVLSAVVGYLGLPAVIGHAVGLPNALQNYLSPVLALPSYAPDFWSFAQEHHSAALEWGLMAISTTLGMSSAAFAYFMYREGPAPAMAQLARRRKTMHELLLNKYWVDEIYFCRIVNPLREMSEFLWKGFDVRFVNGFINFTAQALGLCSGVVSFQMSGSIHRYLILCLLGFASMLYFVFSY
jgi:NADH-quinone oxidoreductase subunit L